MKLLTVGPDNIYTYDTVKEFFASVGLEPNSHDSHPALAASAVPEERESR